MTRSDGPPRPQFFEGGVLRALWEMASDSSGRFHNYHAAWDRRSGDRQDKINHQQSLAQAKSTPWGGVDLTRLHQFLSATNDEVRIWAADEWARAALKRVDLEDMCFFREAVIRREASAAIDFPRQRDHAGHTVYNYLLGWYFYENCAPMRDQIDEASQARINGLGASAEALTPIEVWAYAWYYASLLHDIGYLLEGTVELLTITMQNLRVSEGAGVLHDYFWHRFWFDMETDGHTAKRAFDDVKRRRESKPHEPIDAEPDIPFHDYRNDSQSAVADKLCALGSVTALMKVAGWQNDRGREVCDAFEVWREHYRALGKESMAKKIVSLREAFKLQVWSGHSKLRLRMLDHGVVGGLISLQQASHTTRLYEWLRREGNRENDQWSQWKYAFNDMWRVLGHFGTLEHHMEFMVGEERDKRQKPKSMGASLWWTAAVWGTAACALHNLQEDETPWYRGHMPEKLKVEDDPLAFLSILVDVLQEWDRYRVLRQSMLTGDIPLQGADVRLDLEGNKVRLKFSEVEPDKDDDPKRLDHRREDSLKEKLSQILDGWDRFLTIGR